VRHDVTPFQEKFARAGHAHAGVLLVLALVCQPFVYATNLSGPWAWVARSGVAVSALLAVSLATLGVGLLATETQSRRRSAPCGPLALAGPGSKDHAVVMSSDREA
jgi:hypothetical protein